MELENEAGLKRRNPPWPLVERVVRELDEGHGNSFAILSLPGNTYVQTIRGFNGWHLEWRITGANLEDWWRAQLHDLCTGRLAGSQSTPVRGHPPFGVCHESNCAFESNKRTTQCS